MATELRSFLTDHAIPLERWGTGEAKTLAHLERELAEGETELSVVENRIIRTNYGVGVIVFYAEGTSRWRLREDRQVFNDGRSRTRTMASSIGEKLRPGENPIAAVARAFAEELGITDRSIVITDRGIDHKGPIPSQSFPGLWTKAICYMFESTLPEHLYRPAGYIEHQTDKTNYYVWEKVT